MTAKQDKIKTIGVIAERFIHDLNLAIPHLKRGELLIEGYAEGLAADAQRLAEELKSIEEAQ